MTVVGNTKHHHHRAMAIRHGDKIFVAIVLLILLELSTFSRIYRKGTVSTAPAVVNHQDSSSSSRNNNRRTSTQNNSSSNSALFTESTNTTVPSSSNSYIRFVAKEEEAGDTTGNAPLTTQSTDEIKPRVIFLGNHYNEIIEATATTQTTSSSRISEPITKTRRTVEALGDLNCCLQDPFDFITPEEKPFYDECAPMVDWQTRHKPTCNMLHELPMVDSSRSRSRSHDDNNNNNNNPRDRGQQNRTKDDNEAEDIVTLINTKGSWRSVWKVVTQLPFQLQDSTKSDHGPQEIVLKTLRYDREFNQESFQLQYADSMAMERLTSSPYIANEYGFCGQSVLTEFAPKSGRDLIKNKKLKTWQRLQISHDLAAALSDMHSIDYPKGTNATLTHNDINIANTIQGDNGRIKFNDFNIGILMRWNKTKPCGSPNKFSAPLWRSPEEVVMDVIDTSNTTNNATTNSSTRPIHYVQPEKSDTYALGNLLFQVLTSHQPWTWLEPNGRLEIDEVIQKKLRGELPYIPSKFHGGNKTGTRAMYYSTLACYAHDPDDRPTSYQLAEALRIALDWTVQGLDKTKEEIKQLFDFRKAKAVSAIDTSSIVEGESPGKRRINGKIITAADTAAATQDPALQRHVSSVVSNKTKELLRHKNKQVQDAEASRRTTQQRRHESQTQTQTQTISAGKPLQQPPKIDIIHHVSQRNETTKD